jgi:hypothetical protein
VGTRPRSGDFSVPTTVDLTGPERPPPLDVEEVLYQVPAWSTPSPRLNRARFIPGDRVDADPARGDERIDGLLMVGQPDRHRT